MEMEHLDSIEVSEYTVTEISLAIKRAVQNVFGEVRVRGEISQMTLASSGHCYITLKDDKATLEAVIWRGQMSKLTHNPEEGLEIIAYGRLTTYPPHSKYQLTIDNFEVAGEGALLQLLEDRRKKLLAEGLFEEGRGWGSSRGRPGGARGRRSSPRRATTLPRSVTTAGPMLRRAAPTPRRLLTPPTSRKCASATAISSGSSSGLSKNSVTSSNPIAW